jgi:uncharacterized Zn finger protein
MNKENIEFKECKHTGKFVGGGQSLINTGNSLLVVSSVVCGECGFVRVTVTPIADKKESNITVPKMEISNLKK